MTRGPTRLASSTRMTSTTRSSTSVNPAWSRQLARAPVRGGPERERRASMRMRTHSNDFNTSDRESAKPLELELELELELAKTHVPNTCGAPHVTSRTDAEAG